MERASLGFVMGKKGTTRGTGGPVGIGRGSVRDCAKLVEKV